MMRPGPRSPLSVWVRRSLGSSWPRRAPAPQQWRRRVLPGPTARASAFAQPQPEHEASGGSRASEEDDDIVVGSAKRSATVVDVMVSRGLQRTVYVDAESTVFEAAALLTERRVGSALTVSAGRIGGVFTARDLLRWISTKEDKLGAPVSRVATPAERVAWCSPCDPLSRVREVMRSLGVRNLPVVDGSHVLGVLTAKDVGDYLFETASAPTEIGGKKAFLRLSKERSGLPPTAVVADAETRKTKVARATQEQQQRQTRRRTCSDYFDDEATGVTTTTTPRGVSAGRFGAAGVVETSPSGSAASQQQQQQQQGPSSKKTTQVLDFVLASAALPNPYKRADGTVASRRREYGPGEAAVDVELSEDASFVSRSARYVGVFDGVGSWRKVGVDPRVYPRALARNCLDEIETNARAGRRARPQDVLLQAWRRLASSSSSSKDDVVVGSSTACLATLDDDLEALSYVNLGDSGLVVLRDRDAADHRLGTAEAGREGAMGTTTATHGPSLSKDKAVVLVAPQQLRQFNLPYQLGATNTDDGAAFETPLDANVASFPVQPGDMVILATDGLFDNVAVDDIARLVSAWDDGRRTDLADLANLLCARARDLSLDEHLDSPFAILAKDNDIMWSGGMPDDVTVVAMRVVRRAEPS